MSLLYSIAYSCPAGKRKKECPLWKMNQIDFKNKIEIIKEMSNKSLSNIIDQHSKCVIKRSKKNK